jgi:hypothetical protein
MSAILRGDANMIAQRKMVDYLVACVSEFAKAKSLDGQSAFRYLYNHRGISFLKENYEIEHTLSLGDAVEDLNTVCRNNGGAL